MRKVRVISGMAVLLLALSVGAFAFQNEPEGFRGLEWGDPPTEDMISTDCLNKKEDKWNKGFYRPDDKLAIGSVPLSKIVYSFYYSEPPGLMSVTLIFEEKENYDLSKTILEGIFGKATKSTMPFLTWKDVWIGEKTTIELKYARSILSIEGHLKFFSPQILAEKKKTDTPKEIEEASGDF